MDTKDWKRIPITFTIPPSKEHKLVIDCVRALTAVALSPVVLQRRTLQERFTDCNVCVICTLLHALQYTIMSFGLAIAYTTWNLLPDSLNSVSELPSHAEFMKDLQVVQTPPTETTDGEIAQTSLEDCMICWDSGHPLAKLPCGHLACTRCLGMMSSLFQTACPMCRRPLFRHHDPLVLAIAKGSASLFMVNATCYVVGFAADIYLRDYIIASASCFAACIHWGLFYVIRPGIMSAGKNWWRIGSAKRDLGILVLNLCMSGYGFWTGMDLWKDRLN